MSAKSPRRPHSLRKEAAARRFATVLHAVLSTPSGPLKISVPKRRKAVIKRMDYAGPRPR